MHIAICHENVIPSRGGAEMYVADLTRRLAAIGHDVHLYAARWDQNALPNSITIHQMPAPRGPRFVRPWRFSTKLCEALNRDRPQVSVGFDKTLGTDVYYPLGGLHVASAQHNLLKYRAGPARLAARFMQKLDVAQRSFALLEHQQMTGANKPLLVVNSDFVRRHALQHYGIEPQSIRVVHNAIDPHRFDECERPKIRDEMRRQWGFSPDAVVAATVAMNYRLKGLEPLLNALPLVPTLNLLVVGSPEYSQYESLSKRLGVAERVRFAGHCDDVRRVFFAADLLVHPTFYDPCSLVVLEALACGLPVITTKHNGASELMHPPAEGYVVDNPHDRRHLADRLTTMLNTERRTACGAAARRTAANWTMDHHVRAFESVLQEAANRRCQAAG